MQPSLPQDGPEAGTVRVDTARWEESSRHLAFGAVQDLPRRQLSHFPGGNSPILRHQVDEVGPALPDKMEIWFLVVGIPLLEEGGDTVVTKKAPLGVIQLEFCFVQHKMDSDH